MWTLVDSRLVSDVVSGKSRFESQIAAALSQGRSVESLWTTASASARTLDFPCGKRILEFKPANKGL
jgi:hypothetical protein